MKKTWQCQWKGPEKRVGVVVYNEIRALVSHHRQRHPWWAEEEFLSVVWADESVSLVAAPKVKIQI